MKIDVLSETLVTTIDFFKIFFCLKYLMTFHLKWKIQRLVPSVLGYFIFLFFIHSNPNVSFYSPLTHVPFILFLLTLQGMAFSFRNIVLLSMLYLLICSIDVFLGNLLDFIPLPAFHNSYSSLITAFVSLPVVWLLCRLAASRNFRIEEPDYTMFILTQLGFTLLNGTLIGTTGNILDTSPSPFYANALNFTTSALSMIIGFTGFLLFFLLQSNRRYQQIQRLQQELMDARETYVSQVLTQDQILRRFRHDIRGHLISLRNYLAQGQIQEAGTYMDRIDETLTASESVRYHTKHPVADAILNERAPQLEAQKISLAVTGKLPEKLPISDFDFCQLMYNLLNNAQEACLQLPPDRKRWISLVFDQRDGGLSICVSNPCGQVDRQLRTTKKDKKNHGLGIGNIRQCVDRCHGLLEIDDGSRLPQDQRIFCIDILLPNRI